MKAQLRALLLGDSSVSAIAGSRIDWVSNAQGSVAPRIVLDLISSRRDHNLQGPTGPYTARVQVNIYAETFAQADALSMAVSSAIDGHRDDTFQAILHSGEFGGRENGTNESTRPFFVKIDFIVIYNPAG